VQKSFDPCFVIVYKISMFYRTKSYQNCHNNLEFLLWATN